MPPKKAKKATSQKKTTRKTKPKVPKATPKVKVVVLHCHNCGEDDEKVMYCANCDSPMDVVEVQERLETDIENDGLVSREKVDDSDVTSDELEEDLGVDEGVDDLIEQGGLQDIYSEGDAGGPSSGGMSGGDDDLDDIVSALDDE